MEAHDVMIKYHMSKRTLDRWRHEGRVPFHKVGNFVYFNEEDIRGQIMTRDKRPVLSVSEGVCVSDKELRDRHKAMLLTRKFYKVPP
jgi:predicted site-specific integrase-resolvase